MTETIYSWAAEALADCKNGLDAVNLHELINDLRNDGPAILEKVIADLEAERDRKAEMHDLCPACYQCTPKAERPGGLWEKPAPRICGCCGWRD